MLRGNPLSTSTSSAAEVSLQLVSQRVDGEQSFTVLIFCVVHELSFRMCDGSDDDNDNGDS